MRYLEKLIAKIETEHWILLSQNSGGDWTFEIWGTYPLSGSLGLVSEQAAKKLALTVAKQHLEQHGLRNELTGLSDLSWRVAVRQRVA
jgi:hypothetical protein